VDDVSPSSHPAPPVPGFPGPYLRFPKSRPHAAQVLSGPGERESQTEGIQESGLGGVPPQWGTRDGGGQLACGGWDASTSTGSRALVLASHST